MKEFRADLHIHTLLSPCAGLEMTPRNIIDRAKRGGLDMIGITDHNSTRHALLVKKMAAPAGIYVLTGVEVTTREEVHCLAFFEEAEQLILFQQFMDERNPRIPNDEDRFGCQPVIDEAENILEMIPYYLPAALNAGITEVRDRVEEHGGIFIPAHIDRLVNGILNQLGFIPPELKCYALGLSGHSSEEDVRKQHVLQNKITFIYNSDAHYLAQIGEIWSVFHMQDMNFREVRSALRQENHRFVAKK